MFDPILYWNEALLEVNARDHTPPLKGAPAPAAKRVGTQGPTGTSWAFAIVHLAMYDAFFGVDGTKPTYTGLAYPGTTGTGPAQAAPRDAAVAAAAQCTLSALWPEHEDYITGHATRQPMAQAAELDEGHRFGVAVAEEILSIRRNDGSANASHYASSSAYGRHRVDPVNPAQPFVGPQWGNVAHFVLPAAHVPLDPPPGYAQTNYLLDAGYKADHDEVRDYGALISPSRTPEQTLIGTFWAYDGPPKIGTPPRLYNQVLRVIAENKGNTPTQNAELFALANVAMGEAGIEAWYYKYHYNLWRPVIGVREACPSNGPSGVGGVNGNPDCDPFWLPLGAPLSNQTEKPDFTPPFPAYPSGHATFGAAVFQTVALFYTEPAITLADVLSDTPPTNGYCFDVVSDELDGTTTNSHGHVRTRHVRRYTDLVTPIRENSESRIYLGVHWRFDGLPRDAADTNVGGVPLGLEVAKRVATQGLTKPT